MDQAFSQHPDRPPVARPLRTSLLLLGTGVLLCAVGGGLLLLVQGPRWLVMASGFSAALGAAVTVAGVAATLFKVATRRSVEWFLAWRYLQAVGSGTSKTLRIGLGVLGAALAVFLLSLFWTRITRALGMSPPLALMVGKVPSVVRILQAVALGVALLGYLVTFFGLIQRSFSLFTCISIFGVFIGTAALVIVLSVMGGFESDLRSKILGTTAHVVVDHKEQRPLHHYESLCEVVASTPGVRGATPYLESEVMVTSQTNLSGMLLRGIDPKTVEGVTNLDRYLRAKEGAGSLENLVEPERLTRYPESRIQPMVSGPMGEPPAFADKKKGHKKGSHKKGDREASSGKGAVAAGAKKDPEHEALRARFNRERNKVPPRPVYPGIIIGAELAKNLRLYVGDDVNLVAPLAGMSPMGPIPKSKPFRVAGIFYSGMYEYDTKFGYVTIHSAQKFLGIGDLASGVEVKVKNMEEAGEVADRLRIRLKGRHLRVRDWRQINSNLFSALKLERVVMFIVLTFIVLVASFSIITTLIMLVLEKRREIAALKAMGTTDQGVLKVFLYTGLYIGVIGMLVGLLSGLGFCLFLTYVGLPLDPEVYYISELPVDLSAPDISLVAFASVALSFLATLYPALLAARLRPVEGLRRYTG